MNRKTPQTVSHYQEKTKGKTVWMILSNFYPIVGGDEIAVQRVSQRLIEDHNWSVKILTRQYGSNLNETPSEDMADGLPIKRIGSPRFLGNGTFWFFVGSLLYLLRFGRGGIYEASDLKISSWIAIVAGLFLGGRSIIKLRTGRYRYEKLFQSYFRFSATLSRWYFVTPLRLADSVVVVSREMEKFLADIGISHTRIVYISNPVDPIIFHTVSKDRKMEARKHLGLPLDIALFLYVGRQNKIKGIDVLIRAWQLLPDYWDSALLLLVGHSQQNDFARLITSSRMQKSILNAGRQNGVREFYWAADVFLLASRTEGVSCAMLEAMSCGLPVIVSSVGGSLDMVEDGVSGWFFESENHHQLSERIVQMMVSQIQWPIMGANARKSVVSLANIDVCALKRNELYLRL